MTAGSIPSLLRFGRSWLIWLAIVLPLVQAGSTWHGYSHWPQQSSRDGEDRQTPHPVHCELCLTAADLSGGALPSLPPSLLTQPTRRELPRPVGSSVWLAPTALAYLSRAPPHTPL
jgi:hypothetical protein